MHKGLITIGQESDRTIGQILTAKQWRRLYQIALRIEGTTAVARPDVADAIGLFPAQRAEVAAIVDQLKSSQQGLAIARMEGGITPPDRKSMDPSRPTAPGGKPGTARPGRGVPAGPSPEVQEEGDERDRLLKAAERRIAGILNSSQKKAFNRLLGPDFDLTALVRPPEKAELAPNDGALIIIRGHRSPRVGPGHPICRPAVPRMFRRSPRPSGSSGMHPQPRKSGKIEERSSSSSILVMVRVAPARKFVTLP